MKKLIYIFQKLTFENIRQACQQSIAYAKPVHTTDGSC